MPCANHILIKLGGGTFLDVQWLRLWASNARSAGPIPGQETKIPHPVQCFQKKKKSQNAQDMKSKNIMQEHREKSENL